MLDAVTGPVVPVETVRSAWDAMAEAIGLPREGQAGMKLVRRSMADILRSRLPQEAWGEIEMMPGHARFDGISDFYAPFRPDYLKRALAVIEQVIDEIEDIVPGAFAIRSA